MRTPARLATALLLVLAWRALRGGSENLLPATEARRAAAIYPDYSGLAIPSNIAPLNLRVLEPGERFAMRLSAVHGDAIEVFDSHGDLRIPLPAWRLLLAANPNGELRVDLYAKSSGAWTHFDTIRHRISAAIDPYLVYRYIPPLYDKWDRISLRQRDLRSFDERVIFDNKRDSDGASVEGVCVNCHTFWNHRASRMLLHIRPGRGSQIPALILVQDGRATKVDTRDGSNPPAAYTDWHPNGRLLAFSRNRIMQMFHAAGPEVREVVDRDSDLALYSLDTGQTYTVPQISRPERLETFPTWSPDGRYLYFSSAPMLWRDRNSPLDYQRVQYSLQRVAYDPATNRFGEVETVADAAQLSRSITLPRISPDGRYVMFCGHPYGAFPVFQPGSDLYLLDLTQPHATPRRLDEINSARSDSYHSWSSDGRWVVFASKREDGVFGRLYLSYLEDGGRFSKPFVIPQEDPGFNQRCLMTFNRPELVVEPITIDPAELTRAMAAPAGQTTSPASVSDSPWQSIR